MQTKYAQETSGMRHRVPGSLRSLEPVRQSFKAFLEEQDMGGDALEHWLLVLTEAFANAVIHGCKGLEAPFILVEWDVMGDSIHLEIEDPGHEAPSDWTELESLPVDPMREGGRGLYLIRTLCDRLKHWQGPTGHRLEMVKRHPGLVGRLPLASLLDSTLEELSSSFESLSAFYRLGNALISSERVSAFIASSLEDLQKLVPSDRLVLTWLDSLQPDLREDLERMPWVVQEMPERGISKQEWVFESEAERPAYRPFDGCAVGALIPIQATDRAWGYIGVARTAADPKLNAKELNTIRIFADLFGIAVAHADNAIVRTREHHALQEIQIAATLQDTLVPTAAPPSTCEWTTFVRRLGARSVSGDYAEIISLPEGGLLMVTVDVMGKGVSAAFLAGMLRTALRLSLNTEGGLDALLGHLNRCLCQLLGELTLFATCCLARVDGAYSSIEIANAGHCPALLYCPDAPLLQVEPSGPPLGIFPDTIYGSRRLKLTPGATLLMVTDGLFEWSHAGGDIWGWDALVDFCSGPYLEDPELLWHQLQKKMEEEASIPGMDDDQTLLYWRKEI